jgi:hypothetical protein
LPSSGIGEAVEIELATLQATTTQDPFVLGPDTIRRDKSVEIDQVFEPGCQRTILSGTNVISCYRSRIVDPLPGFPDLHLHFHSLNVFVRLP